MPPRPPRLRTAPAALASALLALALGAVPASAAGAGQTVPLGELPLPPGAVAGADGGLVGGDATRVSLSADGRYAVFAADSDALGGGGDPDVTQVFRKDRATGEVLLVSRADGFAGAPGGMDADSPVVSADGARVAWRTEAPIDPLDGDGAADVYVRDLSAGTTTLATPGTPQAVSIAFDLSADGAFVAFGTVSRVAATDQNPYSDVYRRDLAGGVTALVSAVRGSDEPGDGISLQPSISADGTWIAFSSEARDLTPGFVDNNGADRDVWARNMATGTQVLVSQRALAGGAGGNAGSFRPQLSTPGPAALVVAYESQATDVAAGGADASRTTSVYRRALVLSASVLVSRATGADGASADASASLHGISQDGTRVLFTTRAAGLGAPAPVRTAAYVRDVPGNATTRITPDDPFDAHGAAISRDGAVVAWTSRGGVTADSDPALSGVFARTLPDGQIAFVSRPAGEQPLLALAVRELESSTQQAVSADGRYVLVTGASGRLPGFAYGVSQVYRRDTRTGAIELVSRADGRDGAPSPMGGGQASISADGNRVAFVTGAQLGAGDDAPGDRSVYVRDVAAGTTTLASRADGPGGASMEALWSTRIAPGGGHVVFTAEQGGDVHAFVRDLAAGTTVLADRADGGGAPGDNDVQTATISADGRRVAYASYATNLHPDDADITIDAFVTDLGTGATTLVSRRSGLDGAKSAEWIEWPEISGDGRVVAFTAADPELAPEAGPWAEPQVVARDLASGANTLVSRAPGAGAPGDVGSYMPAINGDGTVVAFLSGATNIVDGQGGNESSSLFARRLPSGEVLAPPRFGTPAGGREAGVAVASISADGRCLAFVAHGHNAVSGPAGDLWATYGHALADGCFEREVVAPPPPPPPPRRGGRAGARRPQLGRVSLLRRRFRLGGSGTAFRFALNERATVRIAFARRAAGKRVGRTCRKPTRKLRRRRACVRWVAAGTLVRKDLAAGRRTIAFRGRVGRRTLAPGAYRATLVARNAAGASRPVRLAFTVLRAAPRRKAPARGGRR